jgi:hypothetical protein
MVACLAWTLCSERLAWCTVVLVAVNDFFVGAWRMALGVGPFDQCSSLMIQCYFIPWLTGAAIPNECKLQLHKQISTGSFVESIRLTLSRQAGPEGQV